jgi:hypothetical protein
VAYTDIMDVTLNAYLTQSKVHLETFKGFPNFHSKICNGKFRINCPYLSVIIYEAAHRIARGSHLTSPMN